MMKLNIQVIVIVLIKHCLGEYRSESSLCGNTPCDECVKPSTLLDHWNGGIGYANCSRHLGNDYISVYPGTFDSFYINWICCKDTDAVANKFNGFLNFNPSVQLSPQCLDAVEKLMCMQVYPPCQSAMSYAIYPCDDVCAQFAIDCPAAASMLGWKCPSLYNAQHAECFKTDLVTFEHPQPACTGTEFTCKNNSTWTPECAYCECAPGWTGPDCSTCISDAVCRGLPYLPIDATSLQPFTYSCVLNPVTDPLIAKLLGPVPQSMWIDLTKGTMSLTNYAVSFGLGNPRYFNCTMNACTVTTGSVCSNRGVPSPCVACAATKCAMNPQAGKYWDSSEPVPGLLSSLYQVTYMGCEASSNACVLNLGSKRSLKLDCFNGVCDSQNGGRCLKRSLTMPVTTTTSPSYDDNSNQAITPSAALSGSGVAIAVAGGVGGLVLVLCIGLAACCCLRRVTSKKVVAVSALKVVN